MDTTVLIGAISFLATTLAAVVGAVIRHLVTENTRLQEKLDQSSDTILAQSKSQQDLITAQQAVITLLQQSARGASS